MPDRKVTILFHGFKIDIQQGVSRAYYIISRGTDTDILGIGDDATMEDAEAQAKWTVLNWIGKEEAKSATASDEGKAS